MKLEVKIEIKPKAVQQQGDWGCKSVLRDAEQTGQCGFSAEQY